MTAVARPDRDTLGRLVRGTWVEWAREQPEAKPSWLVPWEGLPEADREADRRIGEVVYAYAVGRSSAPVDAAHARRDGAVHALRSHAAFLRRLALDDEGTDEQDARPGLREAADQADARADAIEAGRLSP